MAVVVIDALNKNMTSVWLGKEIWQFPSVSNCSHGTDTIAGSVTGTLTRVYLLCAVMVAQRNSPTWEVDAGNSNRIKRRGRDISSTRGARNRLGALAPLVNIYDELVMT